MTEGRILKGIEFAPPATGDGSHPLLLDLYLPASGRRVPTATSCVPPSSIFMAADGGLASDPPWDLFATLRPDAF